MSTELSQEELIASVHRQNAAMAEALNERVKEAAELTTNAKRHLFPTIAAMGIAMLSVSYDGYGDDGNIEGASATWADGSQVADDDPVWDQEIAPQTGADDLPDFSGTLRKVADDLAEWLIDVHQSGYEDGEGGFGTVTLDVAGGTIVHEHSQRRIETDDSSYHW